MLKLVGRLLAVVVAAVALVCAIALTKPSSFKVERSTTIAATPEKIAGLVDDFRVWKS